MLSCQRATVRLMPSIVIEPFGTTYRANSSGTSTPNHQFSPSGVRCDTRPMVSTWPRTKCPPNSLPAVVEINDRETATVYGDAVRNGERRRDRRRMDRDAPAVVV